MMLLSRSARAALCLYAALCSHAALAAPRAEALRALLAAAPEARVLTRQEEGVIDWSAREVSAVGVGAPRLLSPTGGLATEDLAAVALRDAARRLKALAAALSGEGGEGGEGPCGGRLEEVSARRAAESTPAARFSDGSAHIRARLALPEALCGEPTDLPLAWVEAPAEGLLLPLSGTQAATTTSGATGGATSGAPRGAVVRRLRALPALSAERAALRAQAGAGEALLGAVVGEGAAARLVVSAPLDGREVWVWAPAPAPASPASPASTAGPSSPAAPAPARSAGAPP